MMLYDFTYMCLVNVNALELANQREYYIGVKHKPSDIINLECMYIIFYDREQQGNVFFF